MREIFDGETHWMAVDSSPGWTVPFLRTAALVRQEGWTGDALETADPGLVVEDAGSVGLHWAGEAGWSAFSVMLQELCGVLDLPLVVEQRIERDEKWNVTRKWHMVHIGFAGALDDDGEPVYADIPEGL